MNTIVELHDSTVTEIAKREGTAIVHFLPACLHRSEGRPGFDSGTYWVQNARLIFADAAVNGGIPDLPCDVMGGELVIGGEQYDNEIPVPLEVTEPAELRLILDSVHTVTITGRGVRLELYGEPKYVQDFPPKSVQSNP